MIIQIEAGKIPNGGFFDHVKYSRSFYLNDYKYFTEEIKKYIDSNIDNITTLDIKVYNREVFHNGKNELPTLEILGEGKIDIRDNSFTVKKYSRMLYTTVSENEFYKQIIDWVENPKNY